MTLSDIQQSFYSRAFDIKGVESWLLGLTVAVVAIVLYLTYKAFQAKKIRYTPHGSITDAKMIHRIIHQAFDQHRPFEVQVQRDTGQRRPTLRCSPEYIGQKSFTVEISGLKSLSDRWLNQPIAVFFRIRVDKDFTYYTFASHIDGIHHPRAGVCHITLPMPAMLANRQKRSSLRITPPPEFFMGAALWHGEHLPRSDMLNDVSQWPRPQLLHIPERMVQFQILDLSAGGIRLSIDNQVMRTRKLQFNATHQFILMLDLFDPETSKRLRFWMQCRAQNVWVEHRSRDTHMGLQFQSWARPKEVLDTVKTGGVEWLRLSSDNEIEPIGNWIMRRHLELFRDAPDTPI